MTDALRLLCVLAHPDDESIAMGGTLAKYAAEGVETSLLTATRGGQGWRGDPRARPAPERLGAMREAELHAAAAILGIRDVTVLDYPDGELDRAETEEITGTLARHIRRVRPHVVVTFGHDGLYGHPDHIAISQFATAAIMVAADERDAHRRGDAAHAVAKLYYRAARTEAVADYEGAFGEMVMHVDGHARRAHGWPRWLVSTSVDASAHWERVRDAVACHASQLPDPERFASLPGEHHRRLWGTQEYYRAFSVVNGGRAIERDLFEGLRRTSRRVGQAA